MDFKASPYVRTLSAIENEFLQVLLTDFTLERKSSGKGAVLTIYFDDDTAAISVRLAKRDVRVRIPDFADNAARLQKKLDDFLVEGLGMKRRIREPQFPFRYGSGGALPVLHLIEEKNGDEVEKEYYCLFLRDVYPIGWNIANGGTDTRAELIDPLQALQRELREELIVVDLKRKFRYAFADDVGKPLDHPDFANARQIWKKHFRRLDFPSFEEVEIPLKWEEGPDTLKVRVNGEKQPRKITGCFLNINALDFGIEIDRIAHLNIGETASLCDGEITERYPLNRIIGLFDVDTVNEAVRQGKAEETRFLPDKIFFSAREQTDAFHSVVNKFTQHIKSTGIRSDRSLENFEKEVEHPEGFKLCPVTWRIIKRYAALHPKTLASVSTPREPVEVFISFAAEDERWARRVYTFVEKKTDKIVFFSRESKEPAFYEAIQSALRSASCLITVATNPEHLSKPWPRFEWTAFHLLMLEELKDDGIIVPFIQKGRYRGLPLPLLEFERVEFESGQLEAALEKLGKLL